MLRLAHAIWPLIRTHLIEDASFTSRGRGASHTDIRALAGDHGYRRIVILAHIINFVEEQPHFVTNGSLDRPSMHHCICSDYIIHSIFKRVRRHFDLRESHPPRDYNLGPTPVAVKRPAISG